MRIIGPPSAALDDVRAVLLQDARVHPRFTAEMLDPLWEEAELYGLDPVGVIAQSYKETAAGVYPGKVRPEFYNTAGIKIRHQTLFPGVTDGDNPLAHAMFPSWFVGARAHAQHLAAYAGLRLEDHEIVDPRFTYVVGRYALENFEELGGGHWAPSPTYGVDLVAVARKLQGA